VDAVKAMTGAISDFLDRWFLLLSFTPPGPGNLGVPARASPDANITGLDFFPFSTRMNGSVHHLGCLIVAEITWRSFIDGQTSTVGQWQFPGACSGIPFVP
jgi:hypothetical protein